MAARLPVQQTRWDSFQERSELRVRRAWLARFSAMFSNVPLLRGRIKPPTARSHEDASPVGDPALQVIWSTQPVVRDEPIATGWWRFDARNEAVDEATAEETEQTAFYSARSAYNPFKAPSPRLSRRG
jgi:hypothetical protein